MIIIDSFSKIKIGIGLSILTALVFSYYLMDGNLKNVIYKSIGYFTRHESNSKAKVNYQKIDSNTFLLGIDISHWNGNILEDLPKKNNLKFAICKSTQGEKDVDPDFNKNWKFLKDRNLMKGTYHFYIYPQDPIKQAEHFCNTVGPIEDYDFPLIIDIEELSLPRKAVDVQRMKNDLLQFLGYVEKKTNRTPIIYSDFAFLNHYLNHNHFSKYPLWLAEYSNITKPNLPISWKEKGCLIWQKTSSYHINSSDIDFDILYKK